MVIFAFFSMKFKPKHKFIQKIAQGLSSKYTVVWDIQFTDLNSDHIVIIYGILHGNTPLIEYCNSNSIKYFYIDNAYYTPLKGKYYSISLNSPQTLWNIDKQLNDNYLIQTKPYNMKGSYVLISPADDDYMAKWMTTHCMNYMVITINQIRKYTNMPIKIRLKPQFPPEASKKFRKDLHSLITQSENVELSNANLDDDLKNCVMLCTPFSRILMEALSYGKPINCENYCFASEISEPFSILRDGAKFDKTKVDTFIMKVKNSQFKLKDIESGLFFEKLSPYVL